MGQSVVESLRNGTAWFEIVDSENAIALSPAFSSWKRPSPAKSRRPLFFARIGIGTGISSGARQAPPAAQKVEHYTVQKVQGDGRCMFRALVLGMATNKGVRLSSSEERQEADMLRMAVKETLCDNPKELRRYEEALIAITVEQSLKRYCRNITRPNFWGGESELLVLSRLLCQPVVVYIPEGELMRITRLGRGFIPIAEYGSEFLKTEKGMKRRKPVRLLYSGSNHYDLLV